ncbi:MAG: flagellar biosynthetic protein FliR [Acetobacteraceae bacterium]
MNEAALLAALPAWAFAFVLVLSRCSMAVVLLPGLGEAEPPALLRVGLSLGLVALVLPGVGVVVPPEDGWRSLAMVGAELLCGGLLGWLARLLALSLSMAGQIISFMLGLSSVVQPDAALGQSSAMMKMFSLIAPVLVLSTGLWALPVAALAGSYTLVPPGTLLPMADSAQAVVSAVANGFVLAMRLAAPFVFASVIWHVALGLTARLVPHLQIYFAAIPGQIVGGLVLLALLAGGLLEAWTEAARAGFALLPGL